jgi:hypothetical protein
MRSKAPLVAVLVAGLLVLGPSPALAWKRPPTIKVTIGEDPNGVPITIDMRQTDSGATGNGRGGGSAGPRCKYTLANIGEPTADLFKSRPADVGLFTVTCGSHTDVLFLRITPDGRPIIPGPTVDPRQLALSARDRLPVPAGRIKVNPAQALTGLPTWFWYDGYNGQPLSKTVSEFGVTVEVQARPTHYRWDFGDGTSIITHDLGSPFPARSSVAHTYQTAAPGYTVTATFAFQVRWRVAGGAWAPLAPINRQAQISLPVTQSETVIGR